MSIRRLPGFALLLIALISACSAPDPNVLLADAHSSFAAGDQQAAMIHLKNLLRRNPNHQEGRLLRGKVALAMEDGFTAEKDFLRAEELGVARSDIVVMLGQSMMLQGAFDRIVADIHTGAAADKQTRMQILLLRGDAYLGLGKLDNAGRAFNDVARLVPESPDAFVGLGKVAQANGDLDAATNFLARAINVGDELPQVWRANGQIQLAAGRPTDAVESFKRAMELKPVVRLQRDEYALLNGLLRAYLILGETDAALAVANQAMAISSGHPLAHYLGGQYAMHTGDNEAAVGHFLKTLAVYPRHLGALSYLGGISLEQGHLQDAEIYLRQALELDNKNPQIRMQLAQTMLQLQQGDDALKVLAPILREGGDIPELLTLAGRATAASKDRSEWLTYFEQAAAANPTELKWQFELAGAYIAAGEPGKSVQLLLRIPDSTETSDPRDLILVEAYAQAGQLTPALEVANRLLQRRPDDIAIRTVLGRLHLAQGDLAAARSNLQSALNIDPDHIPGLLTLGQVEVMAKNPDAAEALFRQAYTIKPDNLSTVTMLVMLAQERGDNEEAIRWLEAARLTNPDSVLPLVGLVAMHLLINDVSVAYEVAQEAVALHPQDPRALVALGLTQIRREEFNFAVHTLEDAAIAAPDSGMVQFELSKAHLAAKNTTDARRTLRKSVLLAPSNIDYSVAAARLELALKNESEAIRIAQDLVARYPENPVGHRLIGIALTQQNQLAMAADAFGNAWKVAQTQEYALQYYGALELVDSNRAESLLTDWLNDHPMDWQVRALFAQVRHKNGDTAGAIAQYEKILRDNPDNTGVINNLAWLYLDSDLPRAQQLAEEAHRLLPHVGLFTDTLGWVLVKQGEMARGIELLRLAAQQSPSVKDIRFHLAVALAQIGDAEEARLLLSELINSGETFDGEAEARTLLQKL